MTSNAGWKLKREPYRWQAEALAIWRRTYHGIVAVVTGAGKTVFAMHCMVTARQQFPDCRFLVVVPTIALADQWHSVLVRELSLDEKDISVIGGGASPPRHEPVIVVAVLNSVRKTVSQLTSEGHWCLIVDECHHAASECNRKVLNAPFCCTLGLSATPERQYDDWFEAYVVPGLGPVIYRYAYEDARRDGIISDFDLWYVKVPMTQPEEEQIKRVNQAIAREAAKGEEDSPKLKRLLMKRSRYSHGVHARLSTTVTLLEEFRGVRGIVFHESIDAASKIAAALASRNHRVRLYHSGLSAPSRYENMRLYTLGQVDVLVTCRALDEGFDVPDTAFAILAASTNSMRQRMQRLGRVLRPSPKKERAVIVTLYALPTEATALHQEALDLQDVARARWFEASRL